MPEILTDSVDAKSQPLLNRDRFAGVIVIVALILFSSTRTAGDASEYAYQFHEELLGLSSSGHGFLLHLLADKSVHFLLFLSLGIWLYHTPNVGRMQTLKITITVCLLVGISSEVLQ